LEKQRRKGENNGENDGRKGGFKALRALGGEREPLRRQLALALQNVVH